MFSGKIAYKVVSYRPSSERPDYPYTSARAAGDNEETCAVYGLKQWTEKKKELGGLFVFETYEQALHFRKDMEQIFLVEIDGNLERPELICMYGNISTWWHKKNFVDAGYALVGTILADRVRLIERLI